MRLLLALALLTLPVGADAQLLYRYVDEKGQVHMVDDPNKLPKASGGTVDVAPLPRASSPASSAERQRWEQKASRIDQKLIVEECKRATGADSYGDGRAMYGTNRERWTFEKCMAGEK